MLHTWSEPRYRFLSMVLFLSVAAFTIHDVYGLAAGGRYLAGQLLLVYLGPILAVAMLILIVGRARAHLETTQRLNRELEQRVHEKHAELERNYARLAEADRQAAAVAERERLLRDMHDGIGGQLVTTLSMAESGRFSIDELVAALRDNLDDLRLMVQSLDQEDADLLSTLALVRERLEPRLSRQGLHFVWQVEDAPETPGLSQDVLVNVLRIVQEALTNILKHAHATTIRIAMRPTSAGVLLTIDDDGSGMVDQPSGKSHRGLGNMRERAGQIGAELEIGPRPDGPGTRVALARPL